MALSRVSFHPVIPELAASEQLMKFWKTLAKDNVRVVLC